MPNRADRRKAKKNQKKAPVWAKLTKLEKQEKLFRNGITDKDLRKAYDDGYKAAMDQLSGFTMKMLYCATAIALHKLFKFGEERIIRTLDEIQQTMCDEISVQDMFDRCKRETGLDIFNSEYDN